jgi:hypothetical protein
MPLSMELGNLFSINLPEVAGERARHQPAWRRDGDQLGEKRFDLIRKAGRQEKTQFLFSCFPYLNFVAA